MKMDLLCKRCIVFPYLSVAVRVPYLTGFATRLGGVWVLYVESFSACSDVEKYVLRA